jgi:hypothetical protein
MDGELATAYQRESWTVDWPQPIREKHGRWTGDSLSGEGWGEKAETKALAERFKKI